MLLTRLFGGLAVLVTIAAITSGCDTLIEFIEPCHGRDTFLMNSGAALGEVDTHLDGDYKLATIDGRPIAAGGYAIPGRSDGKKLLGGRLHFNSTNTEYSGNCNKLIRSSGSVLAYYQTTTNGQVKDDIYRGGTFTRDHENNTSSMGAFGYSVPLTVELPFGRAREVTLVALIGEFGIGITYTLKFTR